MSNFLKKVKRTGLMYLNPEFSRPKAARLIVTINCNFRCQMCTFWHEKHQDPSLKTVKYWIKELADFGIEEVDIGGGEPFLRKDLPEIVKEIKSYGMKCALTTNGWFVPTLPFPDLDYCEISIDGARPETHDKIRGIKGSWQRAVKAFKIAKNHCPTHLNFTLQTDNYLELADFCHFAKKLGATVGIIPVSLKLAAQPRISERFSEYNIPILKQQIIKALKTNIVFTNQNFLKLFLAKLEKGPIPQRCLAPYRCILIFTNGDIYPCGNFDQPVGNLSPGKKLKEIYNGYQKIRKEVWSGSHPFCAQCVYPDITTRQTIRAAIIPFLKRSLKEKIWFSLKRYSKPL